MKELVHEKQARSVMPYEDNMLCERDVIGIHSWLQFPFLTLVQLCIIWIIVDLINLWWTFIVKPTEKIPSVETTYNSRKAHGTTTKPGRSTILCTPIKELEDHSCKPPVTKPASTLHTRVQVKGHNYPPVCSLCRKEFHHDSHMILWCHKMHFHLMSHKRSLTMNWAWCYCIMCVWTYSTASPTPPISTYEEVSDVIPLS